MAALNRVDLIGNLCADPEIRRLNNGSPVVSLRVATSESWRDKNSGERKEKTEFHSVVIFNEGLAKVAEQYLKKGSKVFVSGSLQTRKWEKDGVDRYTTEVVLQKFRGELVLLDKPDGAAKQDNRTSYDEESGGGGSRVGRDLDDEIPF